MPVRPILAAVILAAATVPSLADGMVDTVLAAMDRGYGTRCGLENKPAGAAGYWPCLDIGPYRFVKGYGSLNAFVILADGNPFPIYRATDQGGEFLVRGEWMRDLAPRVATWWSDEVGGNRMRREQDEASSSRLRDAEREVQKYQPQPPAQEQPAGQPTVQPSAIPQAAPRPEQEAPRQAPVPEAVAEPPEGLRSAPIPTRATPPGGRELAPGVVQLPSGSPYRR